MPDLIRILLFVFTNVVGFFAVSLILYGSAALGLAPDSVPEDHKERFATFYLGGTMWAWIAGMALSLGYFFTNKGVRLFLLWAPVFIPALWACAVLAFFK